MDFSTARYKLTQTGTSELAAGDAVQKAFDTGQPQKLAGLTVEFQYGSGFRIYRQQYAGHVTRAWPAI